MIEVAENRLFLSRLGRAGFRETGYHKGLAAKVSENLSLPARTDQFIRRSTRVTFGSQAPVLPQPQEKLAKMAQQLAQHQLDAYYIPPEDEHLNEYLPHNKRRIEWLSGFTGENAPLLVTPEKMHLFVDGRFHIQVDGEVDKTVVEAYKLAPNTSSDKAVGETAARLAESKTDGKPFRLGYDPFIVSINRLCNLRKLLPKHPKVELVPISGNLVDPIWGERPESSSAKAFALDETITGKNVSEKLNALRSEMKTLGADILPITRLDEIAWMFNVRGGDVPCNPVVESYAILTQEKAYWFVAPEKVPDGLKKELEAKGVTIAPYNTYSSTLQEWATKPSQRPCVLLDAGAATEGTLNLVKDTADIALMGLPSEAEYFFRTLNLVKNRLDVLQEENPVAMQKAVKNPVEIERMRLANHRASRAIIRHMAALEKAFSEGKPLNEVALREDIEDKYKQEPEFHGLSFSTIPALGDNSAIIHYSKADPSRYAKDGTFYLLDSGCQYLGGTTDTTRTTVMGKPTPEQIRKYTAVVRAHIACASAIFPERTNGIQIDAICRARLWRKGLDFAHGTGHGVGAFINVHEGPNRISASGKVPFKPGMVTSIEPGYYEKDWGGIRLEDLYYVAEDQNKPKFLDRAWYKFEHLTLVPFEKKLIDFSELTDEELDWLKDYYQQIEKQIGPSLSPEEQVWLKEQTTIPDSCKKAIQ